MSRYNLTIVNRLDEIDTDNPDYGYRYIDQQLLADGLNVARDRVLKVYGNNGH